MLQPTKREGAGAPEPKARFEPAPGMVVADKYRVERVLGEGGMGVVVAATHLGLEQPVAIKFLHADATGDKDAVERFLREAKVAAMIRSDHVARVHDTGSLEGVPYIVMEHLEGTDLGDLIDVQGQLPIEEACEMALQACAGLAEVHAAGIVHRDLKPSNLFVTRRADGSPDVKLLDFGISKLSPGAYDDGIDPALTATATIMGSPSYMSPEQLKSTKEVDARTDIWSLGAVLYEAVTGKPAFRGENVPQVCAMIASEEPVPPSEHRKEVPASLQKAILGCLVKKPEERITLVELARELAPLAPERAAGLLDRIEATVDPEGKPRAPSPSGAETLVKKEDARARTVAKAKRAATARTRSPEQRRRGGALVVLLLAVGGFIGAALLAGRLRTKDIQKDIQKDLQGKVNGATSVVASATSAVMSAANEVASAVASSLPDPLAPLGSASAAPAGSDEAEEPDEPDEPASSAGHLAKGPGHPAAAGHGTAKPGQGKPHVTKPHHKTWRKSH